MLDNIPNTLLAKLTEEWPPDRVSVLATSTDPKEIEAGASALRDALMLCMTKRELPRPPRCTRALNSFASPSTSATSSRLASSPSMWTTTEPPRSTR